MKHRSMLNHSIRRRGAVVMLVVLCLPLILAFGTFAINVAWMQLTRTELRTATDSAVRAGGRMLSISQDVDVARATAIAAAARNRVAGTAMLLANKDVVFGESVMTVSGKYSFKKKSDGSKDITGVRVTGRRTEDSDSGAVPMLFSGVFDRGFFEPVKSAVATQIDRDVILVLDRSGSMGTVTPGGTRWVDLKLAVHAFLETLKDTPQDEIVGVVTYSSSATRDEHLNLNYGQIESTVNDLSPGGMTAIGRGIEEAINAVLDSTYARSNTAKTIVVMTDGNHNTGIDPEMTAQTAHDTYGITVHTITFSSGANQFHMKEVARKGGGKHWHADDQAELISVFTEVANNLPTLITE